MLLGCIADDFTGASDLANTLARGGMVTTQFVGVPNQEARAECEAGVVSLKNRTLPAAEAVIQSLAALDWLLDQGCRQIVFKYCSTFDSTPQGNIGPVAEALLARLGGLAVVCPAFPAAGRRLFYGHLFVNGQLLSETGMRMHPLTPMSDPDIRRWLRQQTTGDIGLVPYPVVRQGVLAIRVALAGEAAANRHLVVTDAVVDEDLRALGEAIADHRLITGGSGIALGLPANFRRAGLLSERGATFEGPAGPAAVLSGSCSTQTLAQVEAFGARHPVLALQPDAIIDGSMSADEAFAWMMERLAEAPMACSSAAPENVSTAQARHGREAVAAAIESFFSRLATRLVEAGVTRLAVGGGETSGAVVTALGADTLTIGPEIDPGVPALAVEGHPLRLALKSGNFGDLDFYDKALAVMAGHSPGRTGR